MTPHRREIRSYARLISLLRLLVLAVAMAVLTFFMVEDPASRAIWRPAFAQLQLVLGGVAALSLLLVSSVRLVSRTWQLVLHLVFDLVWIGWVIFLSGGVGGPAVPLLFAVVLTSNLVLPGAAPFVVPSVAGLVLATVATLYLAGQAPFPDGAVDASHPLLDPSRILGNLGIQIGALFVVDLLGQMLARRLSEQRLLLGDLIEQLGEAVVVTDRRGMIRYANELFRELLGDAERTVVGEGIEATLVASPLHPISELYAAIELPAVGRMQLTDERWVTVRVNHLRGRGGAIIGRTMVIADETRLHRLEEDALRGQRLAEMGRMAAGIAHEVRNPLSSLRGCAQELGAMAVGAGVEDAASLTGIVVREADRLETIVGEFLSLARPRQPEPRPLDFAELIDEIETMVAKRPDLPQGLRVERDIAPDLPLIDADPGQLRQVLLNLIENGLDAMAEVEVPILAIRAHPDDGDRVRIQIADNGCGIDADDLERVFTPFHSTKSRGTGLGLTVVERIVADHRARMEIASVRREGTRVLLWWPVAEA